MNIPFNDFKREYQAHKPEVDLAIQRVLDSGHYILGKTVQTFEEEFSTYLGIAHTVGVANGMEALQLALMALDIGPGDEVITTSLSAVATALAIRAVGATPVFVDIDEYYHTSADEIEKHLTPKTKAIIPVHLYGQPADIERICVIAKERNVAVIEDCAQAHGASVAGKKVGTFGVMSCFSFYPTKNLGAYGDGGAVVTNDAALAEKIRMMRNYGQKNRYEHLVYGLNSRLDELQAGILSVKLQTLDQENAARNTVATQYRAALQNIPQITLPLQRANVGHAYHLFVVQAERRNELQAFLKEKGIATLIHYPIPIHKQPIFPESHNVNLPVTERIVDQILSLPCNPFLTHEEVQYTCNLIAEFYATHPV